MSAELARELLKHDAARYSAFEASGVSIPVNASALGIPAAPPAPVAAHSRPLVEGVDSRLLSHASQATTGDRVDLAFHGNPACRRHRLPQHLHDVSI